MRPSSRQRARRFGMRAEVWAALWLRAKGYRILARNYYAMGGEIDLIAQRGAILAFVEVKARPSIAVARLAVDNVKAARMSRAARRWMAQNASRIGAEIVVRGDCVVIAPWRWPQHYPADIVLDISF